MELQWPLYVVGMGPLAALGYRLLRGHGTQDGAMLWWGAVVVLVLSLGLAYYSASSTRTSVARRRRMSSCGGAEGSELPSGRADRDECQHGGPEPVLGLNDPRYNGLKLVDWAGNQLPFNEIVEFETEFFKGRVLCLLKTDPEDPVYGSYFHGKQRLFEMQIQGQFKKLPEGVLYMGAELGERMQLGLVTKTVAGMVLTFARRLIKNLHYSFGESLKSVSNAEEIEMPHVTFPLSRGMDRLIITPPGEKAPPIGEDIREVDELRIARRGGRGDEPQFLLGHTYTMSFHSMYIDFVNWQMVNVAGQKSIDLANYFGDSSVHIVVYDLDSSAAASGKHRKSDKRYFYQVELINSGLNQEEPMDREGDVVVEEKGEAALGNEGEDTFLRSGDVVPLLASTGGVITAADASTAPHHARTGSLSGPEAGWGCVTESKGFCLVRPGTNPTEVHLIKVGGSSAYYRSDFLCNGDVVILRNAANLKYLSVYKGWWLFWTPAAPSSSSSRAHFVIHGLEGNERLTMGRAFTLRSSKWSTYEIGISQHASSEYGGRLLGLYQTSKTRKMFQSKKSKSWLLPVQLKCLRAGADDTPSLAQPPGILEAAGHGGNGSASPTRAEKEEDERMEGLEPFVEEEGGGGKIGPEDVEEELEVDVPAWIEMVHRRRKKAQLAYVVRVRFRSKGDVRWMALRTGADLAPVIQMKRDRHADGAGLGKDDLPKTSAQYSLQRPGTKTGGARTSTTPQQNGFKLLHHQSPADQSARLLSHTFADMCSASTPLSTKTPPTPSPLSSPHPTTTDRPAPPSVKAALYSLLKRRNYLDVWFLGGAAADLGVSVSTRPAPVLQSVVARALWETHWREEWAALYPTHVSFYSSGAKKATWSLFLHEILGVRPLDDKARLPFPGKAFLAVEALGRVHYLCFPTDGIRDIWAQQISSRLGAPMLDVPSGLTMSDPREAFVLKSGQWRPSNRLILNSRRMGFDVPLPSSPNPSASLSQLSERALRMAYDLSPDSGPHLLVAFLDLCSTFKALALGGPTSTSSSSSTGLDLHSDEAVAFFLNLYHTLLQHALLLLGPPSSKDWASFFSSISYEVGGDVFSLTEMEHCVIRGRLSRPRTLPRHTAAPPSSDDDHYRYALSRVDFRVNFALINGSISSPPFVTIFRADNLDEQLTNAAVRFIDYTLRLEAKKRTILLPKVCDSFRADFDPSESSAMVVKVCLRYLDRDKWERVSWTLAGAKAPAIKYMPFKLKTHESLHLIEDRPHSTTAAALSSS